MKTSFTPSACMFIEHTPSHYLDFLHQHTPHFFRLRSQDVAQANHYFKHFPVSFTLLYYPDYQQLYQLIRALNFRSENQHLVAILERTTHDELVQLIDLEVQGFLPVCPSPQELMLCFERVEKKGLYVAPELQQKDYYWFAYQKQRNDVKRMTLKQLTKTERKVFFMLAQGKTSRQIAQITCNSVRTIQNHRQRIKNKLGIHGYNQLALVAKEYISA